MDSQDRLCGVGGAFDLVAGVRLEHRAKQIQEGKHVLRRRTAQRLSEIALLGDETAKARECSVGRDRLTQCLGRQRLAEGS